MTCFPPDKSDIFCVFEVKNRLETGQKHQNIKLGSRLPARDYHLISKMVGKRITSQFFLKLNVI